jgi:hypothetical protein
MVNLSVTLMPGLRDGEINARFIASKEELSNIVPDAYDMLFRPDGKPRKVPGAHRLGEVPSAEVRTFPNGKKVSAKSDLFDFEIYAREDGKIAGTALLEDPKLAALLTLGAPCEIEFDSPWAGETAGNGRGAMRKTKRTGRPPGRPTNTARAARKANAETQSATAN